MKNEITLSLFDGEVYTPQSNPPKDIVEEFINYVYVHQRKKGKKDEEIAEFFTILLPPDEETLNFKTDDELFDGIARARRVIERDSHLFSDWTDEERLQAIDLIDVVIKIAKDNPDMLDLLQQVVAEATKRIKNKEFYPKDTFSFPSHSGMFPILDLFSGRPQYIPRGILLKPKSERTLEEEKIADDFLYSIAKTKTTGYDIYGNELLTNYVVICDTQKNYATADIQESFKYNSSDLDFETNISYIHRAFGPEGLRHFMTILSMLGESNTHHDVIKWNLNEHLERMGYKRKSHGSYSSVQKETAIEILRIFTSLNICIYRRTKQSEVLNVRQLFTIVGFDMTTDLLTQASKGELIIRADENWYNRPVDKREEDPQFTKILKKVLKVNHHLYPHTHYLSVLFALFWRIDLTGRLFKVSTLMDYCQIAPRGQRGKNRLRNLENELNFMKMEGYIGDWSNTTTPGKLPSETSRPYSQVISISPPSWYAKTLEQIRENRQRHVPIELPKEFKTLSEKEFSEVIRLSNLSIGEFALKISVSRQTVSYLKSGRKPISREISMRVWKAFPKLFTENVN